MVNFQDTEVITENEQHVYRTGTGVICEVKSTCCYVLVDAHPREAQRAASCLVEPQTGDVVLFARSEAGYWIVAVLVAAGQRNLHLQGPSLHAQASHINLTADTLTTTSHHWEATHVQTHLSAQRIQANVATVEWLSERITSFVGMLVGRFRTSLREVSDIDSTKCGNFDLTVDQTMAIASETGIITGTKLIKLDGAQIHVG
jgi:hypothetical protein